MRLSVKGTYQSVTGSSPIYYSIFAERKWAEYKGYIITFRILLACRDVIIVLRVNLSINGTLEHVY